MKYIYKIKFLLLAVITMGIAIITGCASAPIRTETASSGIRAAEEVGAEKLPQAALHLKLAKDELAHAKSLAAKDESEMAALMLQRSEADSELAVSLSREEVEKAKSREELSRVRLLKQENKLLDDTPIQPPNKGDLNEK